jgi:hypothetical protein
MNRFTQRRRFFTQTRQREVGIIPVVNAATNASATANKADYQPIAS